MSARWLLSLAVVLATLGASGAVGALPDPTTPLAAIAIKTTNMALVEWTPGAVAPDHYAVYGVTSGSSTLLATISGGADPQAEVPSGFTAYEVSAVTSSSESPAATALTLDLPCVTFDPGPPPWGSVGCTSIPGFGVEGAVYVPTWLP